MKCNEIRLSSWFQKSLNEKTCEKKVATKCIIQTFKIVNLFSSHTNNVHHQCNVNFDKILLFLM